MTTPTCPACGAKFAHDSATKRCRKCGLPDEIAAKTPKIIEKWKRGDQKLAAVTLSPPKIDFEQPKRSKIAKIRNKHGRKGVKRPSEAKRHAKYARKRASNTPVSPNRASNPNPTSKEARHGTNP